MIRTSKVKRLTPSVRGVARFIPEKYKMVDSRETDQRLYFKVNRLTPSFKGVARFIPEKFKMVDSRETYLRPYLNKAALVLALAGLIATAACQNDENNSAAPTENATNTDANGGTAATPGNTGSDTTNGNSAAVNNGATGQSGAAGGGTDTSGGTTAGSAGGGTNGAEGQADTGKQVKELLALAEQGKVPGIEFAAHTGMIDEVEKAWGKSDHEEFVGKGMYATYSAKNAVFGYNKGSQIFDVRSDDPSLQSLTLAQIEAAIGKADDQTKNGDDDIYVYKAGEDFQLKFIIPKSTGTVDHISVYAPKDAVNNMAG
ncbi:YjgB family protein [Paenibacillus aurantiacus]|uniref:YjgB family protein n=1 Tax=Paenibacillus aurantiacus TaxID=1936118 RepID=A0ABV5KY93_9BACL